MFGCFIFLDSVQKLSHALWVPRQLAVFNLCYQIDVYLDVDWVYVDTLLSRAERFSLSLIWGHDEYMLALFRLCHTNVILMYVEARSFETVPEYIYFVVDCVWFPAKNSFLFENHNFKVTKVYSSVYSNDSSSYSKSFAIMPEIKFKDQKTIGILWSPIFIWERSSI